MIQDVCCVRTVMPIDDMGPLLLYVGDDLDKQRLFQIFDTVQVYLSWDDPVVSDALELVMHACTRWVIAVLSISPRSRHGGEG